MGDGRAEELSATGDGGPAVISLTPDHQARSPLLLRLLLNILGLK